MRHQLIIMHSRLTEGPACVNRLEKIYRWEMEMRPSDHYCSGSPREVGKWVVRNTRYFCFSLWNGEW